MWKSLRWGRCHLRCRSTPGSTGRYMRLCVCSHLSAYEEANTLRCVVPSRFVHCCGCGDACTHFLPLANAALPNRPTGPLSPLSGRLVRSSMPNGLTLGPVFELCRIVFPSVGAGAILLGGGNPGRAIRGYTEGVAHPLLPLLLITGLGR